jgi:hypothetical protein
LGFVFCKICHILKENYQKLPPLDTISMEVTNTKRDFEIFIAQLGWLPFSANECWGSSPMDLLEEFEKNPECFRPFPFKSNL